MTSSPESISIVTSATPSTSRGVAALAAPRAASRSTAGALRFQMTTSWPAVRRFAAIGSPIRPRPRNPQRMSGHREEGAEAAFDNAQRRDRSPRPGHEDGTLERGE